MQQAINAAPPEYALLGRCGYVVYHLNSQAKDSLTYGTFELVDGIHGCELPGQPAAAAGVRRLATRPV